MRQYIVWQLGDELAIVGEVATRRPARGRVDAKVSEPTEVSRLLDGFVLTRTQLESDHRGSAALQAWREGDDHAFIQADAMRET